LKVSRSREEEAREEERANAVSMMLRGGKGSRSREMKRHERRKELNA